MFGRVSEGIFGEQRDIVLEGMKRTGALPGLDNGHTSKRFEPAIELVYESAFSDAVKSLKQIDEFARMWIAERSLTLAKSINVTTMDALRRELALGFEAGESIQQLTKRIEGYFDGNAKMRATRIARTEVISASNEGALHRYELEGIDRSEFYPSPDACSECADKAGEYPTGEAHGMIPVHPNCKCIYLPVV